MTRDASNIGDAMAGASLASRLWAYQAERFPLGRTALLTAIFSAASISVSAHLAGRAPPSVWSYLVGWVATLFIFFMLRACDEVKDNDDDARFRPERPIPRGLVSLGTIVRLGVVAAFATAALVLALEPRLLILLAIVLGWLTLMSFEFFAPAWLKARPFVYLVSHMAIMPLIDLFVTGVEWMKAAGAPPAGLGWFLGLSFVNGCVLEIGRKIWAPENERPGVETYSSLLGPRRAARLWIACAALAALLLVGVGASVGAPYALAVVAAAALAALSVVALRFIAAPDAAGQKRIDAMAGVWVLVCYGASGLIPLFFVSH
jgi:hypothetical protein